MVPVPYIYSYISEFRNFEEERYVYFKDLLIDDPADYKSSRNNRQELQIRQYLKWFSLLYKGRGINVFEEYTPANLAIHQMKVLTISEYKESLKIIGNVAPVRSNPHRSSDGTQCR